jgi:hypothetical protein
MIIEKKRGRPPKNTNLNKEPIQTTIKNTENDFKKYSLINNNIITTNNTTTKNIIVHLKISKEKLIELENIISKNQTNNMYNDLELKDIYNSTDFETIESQDKNNVINIVPENTEKIKKTKKTIDLKNKSESFENKPVITKSNERRNLIINSGIKYKIHKIMKDTIFKEWPNNTNLYCWYCCHAFTNAPVGIPERMNYNSNNEFTFELYGNFCSYNCAYKYLNPNNYNDDITNIHTRMDIYGFDDKSDKLQMLEMLSHLELNIPFNIKIKPAPPRLSLQIFGGILTIEEFRNNFTQHSDFHIYKSPLISINYNLEETTKPKRLEINYSEIEDNYDYFCKLLEKSK